MNVDLTVSVMDENPLWTFDVFIYDSAWETYPIVTELFSVK